MAAALGRKMLGGKLMQRSYFRRYVCAAALTALAALSAQAANPPVVNKASFTMVAGNPNPTDLQIFGSSFGTVLPTVTIEGVQQTVAAGNSDTFVKILNPNVSAPIDGTHRVTITNNSAGGSVDSRTTTFYIDLDPAGTAGPAGPGRGWPPGPPGCPPA